MWVYRRSTAYGVVLTLVAGLLAGLPPVAVAAAAPVFQEPSVPTSAMPRKDSPITQPALAQPVRPVWPTAGTATVPLDGPATESSADGPTVSGSASPGGLPITVSAAGGSGSMSEEDAEQAMMRGRSVGATTASGLTAVDVSVLDQATAANLGLKGVAFTAAPATSSSAAAVEFSVSYAAFANAYGGGFSDRLRLVTLPACALTTPQVRACQVQTPVAGGRNDKFTASVVASLTLGSSASSPSAASQSAGPESASTSDGGVQVFAVAAGSSSEQGDWGATNLSQAASWQAGSSGGAFTYSVPLPVPPAPGGLTPKVSFDYSSAAVDGLTKSTTSQASWIGEGWNFEPGFVERSYRPCNHDGEPVTIGDLCWVSQGPVTVVLNGVSTRLFRNDANGQWKAEDDSAGWKVERLTGLGNGARDGEAFQITTRDGTRYRFGSKPPSASGGVLNVVVYGNNPGEPCYNAAGFAHSACWMPYRWNLDQVVDVHGNTMDYQWAIFQGSYGNNAGNSGPSVYDISARLTGIEYGANPSAGAAGSQHTGRIAFTPAYRCFDTQAVCDQPGNRHLWMDVPWDQHCETWATSCANHTPTFWNIYRLIKVETLVWTGSGWGTAVDIWETTQGFASPGDYVPPAGDDSSPSLWLMRIWRSGFPSPIEMGTVALKNRVAWGCCVNGEQVAPMVHWRVSQINTGTGETIGISYTGEDCAWNNLPAAVDANNRRCFPQNDGAELSWWHKYVVTDVSSTDVFGGPVQRWHYDYTFAGSSLAAAWKHDLNWHNAPSERTWSQWAGYPTVFTTHGAADGSGPQQVSESLYYRGFDGDKTVAGGWGTRGVTINDGWDTWADSNTLTGQVARTFTWNGAPNPQRSNWAAAIRHHHTVTQTGTYYMTSNPLIVASRVREYETLSGTQMAGPTYRWTQTLTEYDGTYGLPTKVQELGQIIPAKTSDDRCTFTSYATPDTTKWLIGLPSQTLTTNCATTPAAGDYLAGSQFYYDGSTTLGATAVKGLITKTNALATATAAPPAGMDWKQATRSTYDPYGRVTESFDAVDRKTSAVYTPATGGPVTAVASTGPMGAGWTTTSTLDPRRGQLTKLVDVNAKATQAEYDTNGRLLKVWRNNRAKTLTPDLEYGYQINGTNWISTKTLGPDGQQILSYQIFDGRLRHRQTQAPAANGSGRTISLNMFNGIGAVSSEATWYNTGSGPTSTLVTAADKDVKVHQQYVYDNLGRNTNQQRWTGNGTTSNKLFETIYTFDGDKTVTMTPPAGGTATTTINDARGQTVELRQHLGGTPAGVVDVTTKYGYDRLGQLTKVTDTANNTWTYSYDLRGRKTQTVDPDAGTSTTKFDDAGQLTETVDANNNKLAYKYDLLGRKTELRDTSLTGTLRASWTYDTLQKGQLTSTSRFDAGNTYTSAVGSYNNAYQPMSTTDYINGFDTDGTQLVYTVTNTYKPNGAIATQTFPAVGGLSAETTSHTYHTATGLPNAVTSNANGTTTYVASTSYHYDGKPNTIILGGTGKRIKQTSTFDAATRRLTNSSTATETATVGTYSTKLSDTYSYDHAGNIKSVAGQTNGAADQQECFSYDHLQRLTEAWTQTWTTTPGACTTPQRTGADPYRRQWPTSGGYDKLGNRLKQIDKDSTDTTWNYTIGGADSCGGTSKPHAVTSITATGPKAGTPTRTFCYDAAGNTTKRTTDTGTVQTLTWDKEGHLATLADGTSTTSYVYDSSGRRLIAKNANKSTLYLPDGTELEKIGTAEPLGQRYYGAAVRDAAGLKWIITNHQGTGTAQIDSLTLIVNRRRTMPFGEPRGTQPSWLGTKGYVGGTKDDTGLTHLGAREYDPTTGRFISVDPIMDLTDPQQWNAYSYSGNSPITRSDPSGLWGPKCPGCGGSAQGNFGGMGQGSVGILTPGGAGGGAKPPNPVGIAVGVGASIGVAALLEDLLRADERHAQQVGGARKGSLSLEDEAREDERHAQKNGGAKATRTSISLGDGKWLYTDGSVRDSSGRIIYDEIDPISKNIADHANARFNDPGGMNHYVQGVNPNALGYYVDGVINGHVPNVEVRHLSGGRIAYWDPSKRAVIIEEGNGGTVFTPTEGRTYFDDLE